MRLPLFALHTKGLKSLDGIECRGRLQRAGHVHKYMLRISRNTASLYPGPLSRKVHFALLSIATERGFPLHNPVTWSWRDLCRRMGTAYGGHTTLRQLKAAIRSTHGIVLHTQEALFNRIDGKPLPTLERGYHLYSAFAFRNEPLRDGTVAETNAIWFDDWYLQNLNALYSAPLDYGLWQTLDQRSSVASRLYEFFLLNFHGGTPVLRINYPTLAKLLPVRTERYLSDARRQLDPAFQLLMDTQILQAATWTDARDGIAQLHLHRGSRLVASPRKTLTAGPSSVEEEASSLEIQEIRTTKPPAWFLVADFYRRWSGTEFTKPTAKELEQGKDMIERYGQTKAQSLIPLVVKRLRDQWPDAKTFSAVLRYLPEVVEEYDCKQRVMEAARAEEAQREQERAEAVRQGKERAALKLLWDNLPTTEQESIRQAVLVNQPKALENHPLIIENFCLDELGRRHKAAIAIAAE